MSYRSTYSFGFGSGLTKAVKWLLVANISAFILSILLEAAGYGRIIGWLTLTPYAVTHYGAVWQLITFQFLHEGFFHILFNMFALWMFGCELERTWGTSRFLFYYFLTGTGAGLTVVLLGPSSLTATLGASGGIYGLLLAYGLLFPDRMIFLYFLIPVRAKYFVMIMGGIEFLTALTTPGDLVSHVAHLGGIAFGYAYLKGSPYYFELRNRYYRWRRLRLQRRFEVYMDKRDRKEQRRGPWVQ